MRRLTSSLTLGLMTVLGAGALGGRPGADALASDEAFRPIKEAELPKGFPGYTPVGQVELKHYPAYRKATANGASGFWTLFQHIKTNNVEMTAPVEMDFGDAAAPQSKQRSMSFLYERPDQGAPGKQGRVEVADVSAMTVVSIGCRGARTAAAVDDARASLLKWLDETKEAYEIAGPMRIMGYNSPFVPRDKQFFEVQIPVKAKAAASKTVERNGGGRS